MFGWRRGVMHGSGSVRRQRHLRLGIFAMRWNPFNKVEDADILCSMAGERDPKSKVHRVYRRDTSARCIYICYRLRLEVDLLSLTKALYLYPLLDSVDVSTHYRT